MSPSWVHFECCKFLSADIIKLSDCVSMSLVIEMHPVNFVLEILQIHMETVICKTSIAKEHEVAKIGSNYKIPHFKMYMYIIL